jgi:hypothetical protein
MCMIHVLPLLAAGLSATGALAHEFVVGPTGPRAAAGSAALRVGDELPVRVLFEGQPLSTAVFATYRAT